MQVELGGYVGYSCILFGDAVRKAGGHRYYSLEMNPEFAAVSMALVDLAGLSGIVKNVIGRSTESLMRLKKGEVGMGVKNIDLLFLDHYKPAYVTDLKVCEYLKLVGPGTVLAADNVIKPGNPPYLEYVRSSVQDKRKKAEQPSVEKDEVLSGFFGIPEGKQRQGILVGKDGDVWCEGNPNLVYESKLVNSFEPTGIPVSYCGDILQLADLLSRMALRSRSVLARRRMPTSNSPSGPNYDRTLIYNSV